VTWVVDNLEGLAPQVDPGRASEFARSLETQCLLDQGSRLSGVALDLGSSSIFGTPTPFPTPTPIPTPEQPALTIAQSNAISSAQSYLDYTAFSRKGLVDQLVFEGYSVADATFAVDWTAPDWNEQAAKAAQSYLDYTAFSRQGLIDQLVFEGFTLAQAEFGVAAVGY
jgi:hypothetical protein